MTSSTKKKTARRPPHAKATAFLSAIDADWARLVDAVGPCTYEPKPAREPYEALARAVAYQQLHTRAGDAMLGRLLDLSPKKAFPSPRRLLATETDTLRSCGFSVRKIETLREIAKGAVSGVVPKRDVADGMSNEELIERLTVLRGVGRWTVEMILIFTLERMDVLPADDFGVRDGYRRLKSLETMPTRKEMDRIGLPWSPFRSIASWYLWRVREVVQAGSV